MMYRCINRCKLFGKFGVQKMVYLPKVRCLEVPTFTHCGVDMLGHYQEKTIWFEKILCPIYMLPK